MLSLISTPHFDDAALARIQRDQVDIAVEAGSANTIWRDGDTHPTRRLVGAILIVREAHVAARRRIVVGEDIHIFQAKEAARARKRPHILHCPLYCPSGFASGWPRAPSSRYPTWGRL